MAANINADTSDGLKLTSDLTGTLELQSAGTTIATVSSTGIAMASGKTIAGDVAYSARAWVNFDGKLVAADMIQASGNVSSITDSGTGQYIINFDIAMPDANYVMSASSGNATGITGQSRAVFRNGTWTTTVAAIRNQVAATDLDKNDSYIGVIFLR